MLLCSDLVNHRNKAWSFSSVTVNDIKSIGNELWASAMVNCVSLWVMAEITLSVPSAKSPSATHSPDAVFFHTLILLRCMSSSSPSFHMKVRSEEHTSELQSRENLVCRLLLEKKNNKNT